MVLRVESASHGQFEILRLSGRLQSEHLEELKTAIGASGQRIVLDLDELRLVDHDSVSFLASCEAKGIEIRNCSRYIRNWIDSEKTGREKI